MLTSCTKWYYANRNGDIFLDVINCDMSILTEWNTLCDSILGVFFGIVSLPN